MFRVAVGPIEPPVQWVLGLFLREVARAWWTIHPPSNAKVKERVELYLFSPLGLDIRLLNSNECFLCVLFAYVMCAVR